jgi:hypothetical protein
MRKYVIEREMPGVGKQTREGLSAAAQRSNEVLAELGPEIHWLESYVTGDKIFCVYVARDPALIEEHAAKSGFPATRISEVSAVIDPSTAAA